MAFTAQTALVTGGSGYFGSLLRDRLLAIGKPVAVFDLNDAEDHPREVRFVRGDIRDLAAIQKACDGCDSVYHCVAQVPLARDRALFDSVNVKGTENLLHAAAGAKVRKLVYVSSSAVFGVPGANPVTETTEPAPGEAYGHAKLEGERLCRQFVERGLDVSIIRPRTIMGHGRLGIFQILFEWIREGFNVPVLGRGDSVYQFIHADDLADACIRAAGRAGASVYNCGAQEFGTMREALERLCIHANTGSKVREVPMAPAIWAMKLTSALGLSPLGPYHAMMYGRSLYFDISKAKLELGWQPKWSNEAMFVQSYDWYLKNRENVLAATNASHHRSAVKQGVLALLRWLL